MHAQTVLGQVDVADLGVTLPHEHLVIDCTSIWTDPTKESWVGEVLAGGPGGTSLDEIANGPIRLEYLGDLLRAPHLSRDNLLMDDPELIVPEALKFAAVGGKTIVDLSNYGIGRHPERLKQISERTGLHVVMGCGWYVQASHPPALTGRSEEDLAEEMLREVTEGVGDTGIKPGVIGEIGTGNPMTSQEAKVLSAACKVQLATGLPLNIHVSLQTGVQALDLALSRGVDPSRITVSHCDTFSNRDYQLAVAERGAWVSFDNFGANWFFGSRVSADDGRRVEDLVNLIDKGFLHQLLVSHDVGTKIQLTKFGGFGYAYLSRYIEPIMRAQGLSDAEIEVIRVSNPARMLAIGTPSLAT